MESTTFLQQCSVLIDLTHRLHQALNFHARHCVGLTIDQVQVLLHLERTGGSVTVSGLANNRSRANHTMTAMVRTLEKQGVVERSRGIRGDGREVWVSLTPLGQAKAEKFKACLAEIMAPFLRATSPEECAELLRRITTDLSRLLSVQGDEPETHP